MVAWPLRPILRIVGLAAATPEILELLGYAAESIQNNLLDGTIAHIRSRQLLTTQIDGKISLKLLFSPAVDAYAYVHKILRIVDEIRAISDIDGIGDTNLGG